MERMEHKGYWARVEYDEARGVFLGSLECGRKPLVFEAESVGEFLSTFRGAVEACQRLAGPVQAAGFMRK